MSIHPIKDFSNRKRFPGGGDEDNFEKLLIIGEKFDKVPSIFFAGLLLFFSVIPNFPNWYHVAGLCFFLLTDWLLLSALPLAKKSYGPSKTQTLELGIFRVVFAFLPTWIAFGLQIIGTGLLIYGFWIEPQRLILTHQKLYTSKLHPGTSLRLLHLGDLHIERITQREQYLNQLVNQLKPDLILFSGDILNLSYLDDPVSQEQARSIIKQWKAPLGVYIVSGSQAVDRPASMPHLVKDLPLRWLQDEKVTLEVNNDKIDIVGVSCTHRPFIDVPKLSSIMKGSNGNFTIFLYHTPDLAPNAATIGIDLQLSGHTHGGQIRLPFYGAIFAASLYGKRYESSRHQLGGMTLYVTRGIGMEGCGAPRVRFLCPPEIILWEISGSEEKMSG